MQQYRLALRHKVRRSERQKEAAACLTVAGSTAGAVAGNSVDDTCGEADDPDSIVVPVGNQQITIGVDKDAIRIQRGKSRIEAIAAAARRTLAGIPHHRLRSRSRLRGIQGDPHNTGVAAIVDIQISIGTIDRDTCWIPQPAIERVRHIADGTGSAVAGDASYNAPGINLIDDMVVIIDVVNVARAIHSNPTGSSDTKRRCCNVGRCGAAGSAPGKRRQNRACAVFVDHVVAIRADEQVSRGIKCQSIRVRDCRPNDRADGICCQIDLPNLGLVVFGNVQLIVENRQRRRSTDARGEQWTAITAVSIRAVTGKRRNQSRARFDLANDLARILGNVGIAGRIPDNAERFLEADIINRQALPDHIEVHVVAARRDGQRDTGLRCGCAVAGIALRIR